MKVLVCGSRSWMNAAAICDRLNDLQIGDTIITGGAYGADSIAEMWARFQEAPVEVYHAEWDKHGKAAGMIRNRAMLDAGPGLVIAFWDGKSRGTRDTINEARRRGIPVEVITPAE